MNAATETLRTLGVGSSTPPAQVPPGTSETPREGDVAGVMNVIRSDYDSRAYFITGEISDGIYDEDCFFADPTISFTGRELWKRNLQLLVPFLETPSIKLLSLERVDDEKVVEEREEKKEENGNSTLEELKEDSNFNNKNSKQRGAMLRATWILRTGLRLPWRPWVEVEGATDYELKWPENNKVVRHVESWNISGLQALLLVFTPGDGDKRRKEYDALR